MIELDLELKAAYTAISKSIPDHTRFHLSQYGREIMAHRIYANQYNYTHPRRRISWLRLNRRQRKAAEERFGI